MKLLISMCAFVSIVSANEVDRIEKIIEDVERLRSNYETCQIALSKKPTNTVSIKDKCDYAPYIEKESVSKENEKALHVKINKLQEENELLKIVIKDFEKSMEAETPEIRQSAPCTPTIITKEIFQKCEPEVTTKVVKETCEPKTVIKEVVVEKIIYLPAKKKVTTKSSTKRIHKVSKAKTYRVNKNASIYDKIDGKVVDTFEPKTSFTSNVKKGEWIQITGQFIDSQWTSVKCKTLWIKTEDTISHEKVKTNGK